MTFFSLMELAASSPGPSEPGQCVACAVGLSHLHVYMAKKICAGLWLEEEHTQ